MKKARLAIFLVAIASGIIAFFSRFMFVESKSSVIMGFALDSQKNVYIGNESSIQVYDKDSLLRTIDAQTSRGYTFTIKDDIIYLSMGAGMTYKIDLNGVILERNPIVDEEVNFKIRNTSYSYTTNDGQRYRMQKNPFQGYQIYCLDTGEIMWSQDIKLVLIEDLGYISVICLLLSITYLFVTKKE